LPRVREATRLVGGRMDDADNGITPPIAVLTAKEKRGIKDKAKSEELRKKCRRISFNSDACKFCSLLGVCSAEGDA